MEAILAKSATSVIVISAAIIGIIVTVGAPYLDMRVRAAVVKRDVEAHIVAPAHKESVDRITALEMGQVKLITDVEWIRSSLEASGYKPDK